MANALNRREAFSPRRITVAGLRRDAFGPRRAVRVLLAEVDRRIVGFASFAVGYNTDVGARELWMHDLFVAPRWRSRGVGRALVSAVAREAVRRGIRCVEWAVRGTNRRAVRFYRRLGAHVGHMRIASLRGQAVVGLARTPR